MTPLMMNGTLASAIMPRSSSTVLLPAGGFRFFKNGRPAASMSMATANAPVARTRAIFSAIGPGIPRLYGWNAKPGIGFYRLAGTHHNRGIGAVTGESQDPGIVAGRNQNIIVLQVGVLGAVMQLHGTHRARQKPGCGNCGRTFPAWCPAHPIRKWCPCSPARSAMRCNCGWQHHPRPWHRDPAPCCGRHAITHRARFAGPHLATRCSKYFVIRHGRLLLCGGKSRSVCSLPL